MPAPSVKPINASLFDLGISECLPKYDMLDVPSGSPFNPEDYDNPFGITNYIAWTEEQALKFALLAYSVSSPTLTASDERHPVDRICDPLPFAEEQDATGYISLGVAFGNLERTLVRLYEGDKSDEDNFIGYAFAAPSISSFSIYFSDFSTNSYCAMGNYETGIYTPVSNVTYNDIDFILEGSAPDSLEFFTYI